MKPTSLCLATLFLLALAACRPTEPPASGASSESKSVPAALTETASTAAVADQVGVDTGIVECDIYLKKTYACINDKIPVAQRDMIKQGIERSESSWAAVTDKAALAAECKAAMEQAKASFGAWGCSF